MTMITPSYLGETIEYSSLHACRSTLEDPTSNTTPSDPAAPGGSEVTGNPPSAAQPSGAGAPTTTNPSSGPVPVRDAIGLFMTDVAPLVERLRGSMLTINPTDTKHHIKVSAAQVLVIPMASAMVRTNPTLSGVSADALDNGVADVEACTSLSRYLIAVMGSVTSTSRLSQEKNWEEASAAIAAGRKKAPRNANIAKDIAEIDGVLAKGSRVDQAGHVAVAAQSRATKATARAAKATATATAATARATALQHGTGGANITQPAPSAPAPSTTAPSAPAPGSTPGTPGSTTIR